MYPAQARHHHQLTHSFDEDMSILADKRSNPSLKTVQHLRHQWVTQKHGGLDDFSVVEAILKIGSERPRDRIRCEATERGFVAVLVTEFMLSCARTAAVCE